MSAEPLLEPINLAEHFVCQGCGYTAKDKSFHLDHHLCTNPTNTIDWVITGGESDLRNPRPMEPEWVFDIRDQCRDSGVPFFHKQHGGSRKINGAWGGRKLNGRTWDEIPTCEKVEAFGD